MYIINKSQNSAAKKPYISKGVISTSVCSLLSGFGLSAAILAVALLMLEAFSWKALSLPCTLPHSGAKASTTRQAA